MKNLRELSLPTVRHAYGKDTAPTYAFLPPGLTALTLNEVMYDSVHITQETVPHADETACPSCVIWSWIRFRWIQRFSAASATCST
jgi:hypothetical protein